MLSWFSLSALPDMQLNIFTVGSTKVGHNLNITCTVRVVERLVVTPTIEMTKMNTTGTYSLQHTNIPFIINIDKTGTETNWTIILEPLKFEDKGVYICKADFNVTGVKGTDDPATATYDGQFAEKEYDLYVNGELYNCTSTETVILSSSGRQDLNITLVWPETIIGRQVIVNCPCGNGSLDTGLLQATRYCGGNFTNGAKWAEANIAACNLSDLAREICMLKNVSC